MIVVEKKPYFVWFQNAVKSQIFFGFFMLYFLHPVLLLVQDTKSEIRDFLRIWDLSQVQIFPLTHDNFLK